MTQKQIKIWTIWSTILIIVIGSFSHFMFEWLGSMKPLALIFAVNESVWEHLKLAFWPTLLFAITELFIIKNKNSNFWLGKVVSLYTMPIVIVIMFYTYHAVVSENNLAYDISSFFIAVILGQYLGYKIITREKQILRSNIASILLFILILSAFSLLTYFPPKLPIFKDGITGEYGIMDKQ